MQKQHERANFFEQLISPLGAQLFGEKYFNQVPLALAGSASALVACIDKDLLRNVFEQNPEEIIYAKKGFPYEGDLPRNFGDAKKLFDEGYTFFAQHIGRDDPVLSALSQNFAEEFGSKIDLQLFWTKRSGEGFSWHYDVEDVFIVQLDGSKEYFLRRNSVFPWPTRATKESQQLFLREPSHFQFRCELQKGDLLYVPSGYWHSARALEDSLHLSIGVLPQSQLDLLDYLKEKMAAQAMGRLRLPTYNCNAKRKDVSDQSYDQFCNEFLKQIKVILEKRSDLEKFFHEKIH